MKKIIILGTLLMTGIVTQAATYKWSTPRGDDIIGFDGETYSGVISLYAYATSQEKTDSFLVDTYTSTNGRVSTTSVPSMDVFTEKEYNFYIVITDTGSEFKGAVAGQGYNYYYESGLATELVPGGEVDTTINFTTGLTSGSASQSNWTAAPEPTSGLLLLCGLAGLALRRKRA